MVYGDIGYTSRPPNVHIDATLNSAHYNSGVLPPVYLHFIRAKRNPTFQQDNAIPHVASIIQIFLHTENVQLLPWTCTFTRSLVNRKRLFYGCQVTVLSSYASHYG
ncbi:transposable element Tcb1 transposase [Trichonephila clavipes]|nr:transposable element Tcb1 transposase [Trichonephila clavipes]